MIILADVVTHNGSDIPDAALWRMAALIADQQETAFIVMTVVVLDDGISAVPIRVKPFAVSLALGEIGLIVLNGGIVSAPRPDRDVVALRPLIGSAYHVVFNERAVGGDRYDAISADIIEPVVANNHSQARVLLRPH